MSDCTSEAQSQGCGAVARPRHLELVLQAIAGNRAAWRTQQTCLRHWHMRRLGQFAAVLGFVFTDRRLVELQRDAALQHRPSKIWNVAFAFDPGTI